MDIKKYLTNEENQKIIIGFLSILIFLWLILYVIPGIFSTLFHTLLGNLILLLGIILLGIKDIKYSLLALLVVIVLYRFSQLNNQSSNNQTNFKEGFTWSQQSTQDFLKIQETINPHVVFDTNKIQQQATQEEVDYFLQNQMWPWSQEVQDLYKESVMNNQYVQINPDDAVNQARQIYNQQIILEIISWQKKEGQFLLNGIIVNDISGNDPSGNSTASYSINGAGSYAFTSGLISNENNPNIKIIKCKSDPSGNYALSQGQYNDAQQKQVYTEVEASDLENIIPGFKFVSQPCNPCVALNSPPNYMCPFTLDLSNSNSNQPNNLFSNNISKVWQYLWGINTDPLQSVPSSTSETNTNTNANTNPNDFPILGQLQVELNGLFTTQTQTHPSPVETQPPEEPTTTTSMSASTV